MLLQLLLLLEYIWKSHVLQWVQSWMFSSY